MTNLSLNRMNLVGNTIDEDTPVVVLHELARSKTLPFDENLLYYNSEYRANIRLRILEIPSYSINFHSMTDTDIGMIARYVSPLLSSQEWMNKTRELFMAVSYIDRFILNPVIPIDFQLGSITPTSTLPVLDACMMYNLLIRRGVRTRYSDNIFKMARMIRELRKPLPEIMTNAIALIRGGGASFNNLMNFIGDSREEAVLNIEYDIDDRNNAPAENYRDAYNLIANSMRLRQRIPPLSDIEAITFAALNNGINIRQSSNPILEYSLINENGNCYIPTDENLRLKVFKCKTYLNLNRFFDPYIDRLLYTDDRLADLLSYQGISDLSNQEPYVIAQWNCVRPIFYEGLVEPHESVSSVYGENISDYDPSRLVSFGLLNEMKKVFTYNELASSFETRQNFNNPISEINESFQKYHIRQLQNICNSDWGDKTEKERLRISIERIIVLQHNLKYQLKKFRDLYFSIPQERQEIIKSLLIIIYKMALTMRGWRETDRNFDRAFLGADDDPENTEVLSSLKIEEIYRIRADHPVESDIVLLLPLIKYIQPQQRPSPEEDYELNKDPSKGLTLEDRLRIVLDKTNIYACIRMSSNIFLSTTYCFLATIGHDFSSQFISFSSFREIT